MMRRIETEYEGYRFDQRVCEKVIDRLAKMEGSSNMTLQQRQDVVTILRESGATFRDFQALDEIPGYFGYEHEGREWHYKLRQTRNRGGDCGMWEWLDVASAEERREP